jgi:hypothetical protein
LSQSLQEKLASFDVVRFNRNLRGWYELEDARRAAAQKSQQELDRFLGIRDADVQKLKEFQAAVVGLDPRNWIALDRFVQQGREALLHFCYDEMGTLTEYIFGLKKNPEQLPYYAQLINLICERAFVAIQGVSAHQEARLRLFLQRSQKDLELASQEVDRLEGERERRLRMEKDYLTLEAQSAKLGGEEEQTVYSYVRKKREERRGLITAVSVK